MRTIKISDEAHAVLAEAASQDQIGMQTLASEAVLGWLGAELVVRRRIGALAAEMDLPISTAIQKLLATQVELHS